jgi:DNA-binding ferritin-like protein
MPDDQDFYDAHQDLWSTKDPYTGLHAESIYALWHDPSTYDHMRMGPPYLPDAQVRLAQTTKRTLREEVQKYANDSPVAQIFSTLVGQYQGIVLAELGALVAVLRAAALIHQSHHWQTRGDSFYGDHLLYERLYDDSLDLVDRVAERAVGSGHRLLVQPVIQADQVGSLVKFFCGDIKSDPNPDEYAAISFMTEVYVLSFLGLAYNALEASQLLTNGTDNLLQDVSDKHESFMYLLRQRVQNKVDYDRSR